ncbi:MAG TPA: hypothetical protein PLA11_12985 [Flavobacteriales bacterium]|nr:hypothetical protein [Flavobacteriales bacterium]HPF67988.1 hypothetical protein [Flavobacteriales bacterium]
MHHRRIFPAWFLLLMTACIPAPTDEQAIEESIEATRDAQGRWPANAATTEGVHGMQALVAGYPDNGLTGGLLKDSLEERMGTIFVRCTMEGEAHEDLHDYLLPLMGMYRELPADPDSAQLAAIRLHLAAYDERFH